MMRWREAAASQRPRPARAAGAGVGSWRLAHAFALAVALAAVPLALGGCGAFVVLRDPLTAAEHNDLGVAYEARGEWDLAAREYRRALGIDGRFARARVNLGNVAARRERWPEAERHYRAALRTNPEDADACNNLAVALLRQGRRLGEAEDLARRAIHLDARGDSLYRGTLDEVRAARLK